MCKFFCFDIKNEYKTDLGLFKEIICDRTFQGQDLPNNMRGLCYININIYY